MAGVNSLGASVLAALSIQILVLTPPAVAAGPALSVDNGETAAVAPMPVTPKAAAPRVLSDADAQLYRRVFEVQEDGDWKEADRLIAKLSDRVLMGHVLAQRYLHPRKYRSHYKELKAWMAEYADHPQAARIYQLSLRRRPKNWRLPDKPDALPTRPMFLEEEATAAAEAEQSEQDAEEKAAKVLPTRRLDHGDARRARALKYRITKALRRGHTLVAKRLIQSPDARRLFSTAEMDQAKVQLATRYFFDRRTDWAAEWLDPALKRSGKYLPDGHWTQGLIAWKEKDYVKAATHFRAAADIGFDDEWLDGAANFWAARGLLVTRKPELVGHYLDGAARHARTFYGLLAARILGREAAYEWSSPPVVAGAVNRITETPRGRRAMALVQAGDDLGAERELRNLARLSDKDQALAILAVADAGGMAGLAVRLSDRLFPDGGGYDGAAYPVPSWEPQGGFTVDRALVYAFIRQESKFNPRAKSWAGARGLMQLMPRTASFVAQDSSLHRHHLPKLYDPDLNLQLGQKYIDMLLVEPHIQGDLLLLAAAWNGGPGNLNKWRRRTEYDGDPLFFIESIPAFETRHFVERVLANLWIYRDRLGQDKPSLDALAAGRWPVYKALGHGKVEVATFDDSKDTGISAR
ncbi:MAG: transglycosylase [Rhodospirillales bacterium CG15_BIG_FIL_POST_REV_8_21_14_020_66_15]|nr:MAG: transglycosylase [Rhodospirillales bacterium CG15_BIG_FIL_POST_REV_8_21_14_020_66_15]